VMKLARRFPRNTLRCFDKEDKSNYCA
jgi:hypothetical protein